MDKTQAVHTPGPWTQCDEVVVVTPETHGYATWLANCSVGGNARAERMANARLVAAAPALLRELIILRDQITLFTQVHGEADFYIGGASEAIGLALNGRP